MRCRLAKPVGTGKLKADSVFWGKMAGFMRDRSMFLQSTTASSKDDPVLSGQKKYQKPELTAFGRIDQLTLGSGGSCVDGVQADKALPGSGNCP
jgi:hypothetical protein